MKTKKLLRKNSWEENADFKRNWFVQPLKQNHLHVIVLKMWLKKRLENFRNFLK